MGKKVVGAAASNDHTAVWTEAGELFTFGSGLSGRLGHGGEENVLAPRLVDALAGLNVIGASAGVTHTVVWTEEEDVFTFGSGKHGKLGHGGEEGALVPKLVDAPDFRPNFKG